MATSLELKEVRTVDELGARATSLSARSSSYLVAMASKVNFCPVATCRQTGRFERSFGRRAASQTVAKTGQTAKQAMQQEGQALSDLARKRRSRKAEKTSQLSTVSLFCFFRSWLRGHGGSKPRQAGGQTC